MKKYKTTGTEDIKIRRCNILLGIKENKEDNTRTGLIMSVVSLVHQIALLKYPQREVLQGYMDDIIEDLKLTEKEQRLFDFEVRSFGI